MGAYPFYYDENGILHPSEKRVKITKCTECGREDLQIVTGLCRQHYNKRRQAKKHKVGYNINYHKT
jgi:hypothetical protein